MSALEDLLTRWENERAPDVGWVLGKQRAAWVRWALAQDQQEGQS